MDEVVLDASAILALLRREAGSDIVAEAISASVVSAVNLSETVAKLSAGGMTDGDVRDAVGSLRLNVVPFDEEQAYEAGYIVALTKDYGLSLGDRACLGLARSRGLTALTADRAWKRLSLAKVRVVR